MREAGLGRVRMLNRDTDTIEPANSTGNSIAVWLLRAVSMEGQALLPPHQLVISLGLLWEGSNVG